MRIIQRLRMCLAVVCLVAGCVMFYMALDQTGLNPALLILLPALCVIVVFILVYNIKQWFYRRFMLDKALRVLNKHCDPQAAIALSSAKIAKARKRGKSLLVYQNNLAVALHAAGQTSQAIAILENLLETPELPSAWQAALHGNLAVFHYDSGDYAAFWEAKRTADACLKNTKAGTVKNVHALLTRLEARDEILNGNYEKALAYFKSQMRGLPAYMRYGRVHNMYLMAGIYEHMCDFTQSRACLRFVAANGNKLHIADQSRLRLSAK